MTLITEGGLLPSRIEYVAEATQGVTPADPAWEMPSERVTTFNPGYALNWSEDAGLGSVDYSRTPTTEESELTIAYALQRWLFDSSGGLQDMAAYGMVRASSNRLPSSLSVVRRVSSGDVNPQFANAPLVEPASTVNARYNDTAADDGSDSTAKVTRAYDVLKGVDVGEAVLTAERDSSAWQAELTCPAEHARSYRIDQPTSSTEVVVFSTDSSDTNYTVHIENEGGATSEDIPLDGTDATTVVVSANTYTDIDVIEISDPNGNVIDENAQSYTGNIVVAINSGTSTAPTEGEWLSVMFGTDDYGNTYADPGTPALGAGSHASAISGSNTRPSYYRPQNMAVERPTGEVIEHAGAVQSVELSVANNTDRTPSDGREQRTHHGMRGFETTLTMDGETISEYFAGEMQRGTEATTRFLFNRADDEYVDAQSAIVSEVGTEDTAGENSAEREYTVLGQRGPDGEPAINISSAGSGP